jgi:hypothetical protein
MSIRAGAAGGSAKGGWSGPIAALDRATEEVSAQLWSAFEGLEDVA